MPKLITKSSQASGEERLDILALIPRELMDEIDRIVSMGLLGYRSRMERIH